jgi:hypothetical protein
MKFKFEEEEKVVSSKLMPEHKLKGFLEGQRYKCFVVGRNDQKSSASWGLWIEANSGAQIRLQDLNGNVTGHGDFFEPFEPKQKEEITDEIEDFSNPVQGGT